MFKKFASPLAASFALSLAASRNGTTVALDAAAEDQRIVDSASSFNDSDIAASAAGVVQQWTETGDLGDGEGLADRLIAMLIGVANEDAEGDLSDDEQGVVAEAANAAWDYMASKGAVEEDLSALFGEDAAEADAAAERIRDLMAGSIPDGEEAAYDDVNNFAFRAVPVMDAVYKKRKVVRNGRIAMVLKRVAGKVQRSAAQKMAIRKARMKSHGSAARMHRAKSMRVRKARGL